MGGAAGGVAGCAGWFQVAGELRAADGSLVLFLEPAVVGVPELFLAV